MSKETAEIIEMAKKMIDENQADVAEALSHLFVSLAECLYDDGYRKQSDGEWEYEQLDNFRKYKVTCPFCKSYYIGNYDAYDDPEYFNFCPNCGAKMKGGAE